MIKVLLASPLLLLFLVAALGDLLGRLKVAGFSLGVSAVLFVGLGFGALHPELKLPEVVYQLGLVLFVYTIGLASGPGFVAAFRTRGLRDNLFVLALLSVSGGLVAAAHALFGWSGAVTAGVFTGAFTNTPALAGVLQALQGRGLSEAALGEPVLGYSVTYPVGVIGMLLAISILRRRFRPVSGRAGPLVHQSVQVSFPDAPLGPQVRLARLQHGGQLMVAGPAVRLAAGDVVSVVGEQADVEAATRLLGQPTDLQLEAGREGLDMRRIAVSHAALVGRTVGDLHLPERFGALVTRIRRGDVDLLAHEDTVLELGDRLRVVAPPAQLGAVARLLGDSARRLSEAHMLSFGLGIALGLLLGLVPLPLPGGGSFHLGFAGGPLLVGLLLGALGHTGPLVWPLPQGVNLSLRQLGLTLFLAGVGTRSGWAFATTFGGSLGLSLFVAGAIITTGVALLTLWAGHRVLRLPFDHVSGLLAGLQTQPAVLAFASEQSGNEAPNVAYAGVYPLAMVAKIVIAQLLLGL
jgi:putative transport protein